MPPEISIVTVYYNTPEELLRLARSMQELPSRPSFEWIVVDNHSDQELAASIPLARYLRMPANLGFAAGSNRGAEAASAPFLFFVNPDCELIGDCMAALLQGMQSAAVAGPQVLNSNGSIQLSFGPFLSIASEALQKFRTRHETSTWMQNWLKRKTSRLFYPDYVSGCAMMIRAELFHEMGGFDENFFLYEEDVDLCKRVTDRNGRIVYVPDAKIVHTRNRSVRKDPAKASAEYRRSQLYYYRKHNSRLQNVLLRIYLGLK